MKALEIKYIIRILSFLLLFEAFFMLLTSGVSFLYNEADAWDILLASGITVTASLFGILSTPNKKMEMGKKEGYLIVSVVWVIFSFFGLLPFYLSGAIPSFTDAFFETMSGFTTTGASIVNNIEGLSHGLLFWRSLIQWLGGMGIIVLSLAILPLLSAGGISLFAAEVPGPTKEKIHAKVSHTAKTLWGIYLGITLVESICLYIAGMGFFDAICHSFTTMATGGFSTKNASIAHWNSPAIEYVIIVFMFLAGANFSLYFFLFKGKFRKFLKNEELKYYTFFTIVLTAVIAVALVYNHYDQYTAEEIFRYSLFSITTLMTTTGFANFDFLQWAPFIWTVLLMVMLFGGSAGSTAGGIKTVRITLLLKNSYYEFKRLIHPNAIIPIRFNKQLVKSELMNNVLAFVVLYILIAGVSVLIFTALGLGFDESIGTAFTAIGNVGPGLGDVGPASNFSSLNDLSKWYMSFLMLIGRLELFTVLMIFTPAFWKK